VPSLARRLHALEACSGPREKGKPMPIDPEELLPRKKAPDIVLGEDLSAMSEHELEARIVLLETEIARANEAIAARRSTRSQADSFFKK